MQIVLSRGEVEPGEQGDGLALNHEEYPFFGFFLSQNNLRERVSQKKSGFRRGSIQFLVPGCLPAGPLVTSTFFQQGRRRN